jgi:hypothetical protein
MRQGIFRRLGHLEALQHAAEKPIKSLRIVVTGTWEEVPGTDDRWYLGPLDLEKSKCTRTLCGDGTLMEIVTIHGKWYQLSDDDMERWIATHPVERG